MIKINLWTRGSGRNPRAVFLSLWLCLTILGERKAAPHVRQWLNDAGLH